MSARFDIGTVIRSCDGFHTSFVIGTDRTFMVPDRCEKLALAINNLAGAYDDARGLFELSVMIGAPVSLPTRLGARGGVANPKYRIPAGCSRAASCRSLCSTSASVSRRASGRLAPTGYVDYAIYMSRPDQVIAGAAASGREGGVAPRRGTRAGQRRTAHAGGSGCGA
jgi:hypothetical protein